MFTKVLIANRGEIAVRTIRTLKAMGVASVAVHSHEDRHSLHVTNADEGVALTGNGASETYLDTAQILAAAKQTGAEAIIPGYGFLSENADFAEACEADGIAFIGPTPDQMREFGLKHRARELAETAGVPLAPGSGLLESLDEALQTAERLGYPVMLKSTAGGGGIGLTRCNTESELREAFETVRRQGQSFFNDSGVFLERFIARARHVEVQIFGDGEGKVVALGERDCSLQRRNQKVVEETPAPNLPAATRQKMLDAAVSLGQSVNYRSAGTVEYIYDADRDEFYFLEVNTRLQVEHPVTESVTGLDLIEWMLKIAAGESPDLANFEPTLNGASMEVRIYAEDPLKDFQPSPGELTDVHWPEDGVRIDTWVENGSEVSAHYDPMIAKLIVHGKDRDDALAKLKDALAETRLMGIATNLDYLRQVVAQPSFAEGIVSTRALESFEFRPSVAEIVKPGTYTTVQDYPGRVGYWNIGVPPSGPMDDYAFRLANRIVGNHNDAAGLEATLIGPSLKFHKDAVVALTGALTDATLDDQPVEFWKPITVKAGQVLAVGKATKGCRTYLAVRGGFDVPVYLGSRSTFALGQFGGHGGRPLRPGDMLGISQLELPACTTPGPTHDPAPADPDLIPDYPDHWEIGVLYGPHGAPDFFSEDSIEKFFEQDWEVHYNSNRLGIRLNGPKPEFTREDGGEAGLHPSNIHDCEYAIGSINFTGDMPVILTKDGPSLGGFVCPVTIAKAELWKVGQVKPGDTIRFVPIDYDTAVELSERQELAVKSLMAPPAVELEAPALAPVNDLSATILAHLPETDGRPEVTYRQAGDQYILLEYGPNVMELGFRLRIHALMEAIADVQPNGLLELSPGVRSLQLRYDSRILPQPALMEYLLDLEGTLPATDELKVRSRVIHLPMAFEDSATLEAVDKYRQSVRDTAPWLPNNVDFIQRINGLKEREHVKDVVYNARYLVLGLGDVYLGAPCAVPLDPRHRLLTSKYNPARTYTAEGTVGIGGVYMCIYGMDSPGGYQLVGRTLPIWNKYLKNPQFAEGAPWLLRFFDQVCYYPVSEKELDEMRDQFRAGKLTIKIEEETFDLKSHQAFLDANADSISEFRKMQQAAYAEEVALWKESEAEELDRLAKAPPKPDVSDLEQFGELISAEIAGNIWKCLVKPGDTVAEGDPLVIVEAMKMEFEVNATQSGKISALHVEAGKAVTPGEPLLSIEV
ncbi:urea carboxylase [Marinobacter persicus]|uniref:Biotin carboxylase n=1 Tax=Marinobacter persicus TaxID=930118 RepID=A0A2S6G2B0_9GAMM|nr:urea carboxylase [Marinobacter persicus]PPK49921.1 urea carboxylase [Marinobacter persicus]PPK51598.1 urea carboxylase [Marinobacter persicus]PPK56256.1 urea carboxylase [Marinobacter persicus]